MFAITSWKTPTFIPFFAFCLSKVIMQEVFVVMQEVFVVMQEVFVWNKEESCVITDSARGYN